MLLNPSSGVRRPPSDRLAARQVRNRGHCSRVSPQQAPPQSPARADHRRGLRLRGDRDCRLVVSLHCSFLHLRITGPKDNADGGERKRNASTVHSRFFIMKTRGKVTTPLREPSSKRPTSVRHMNNGCRFLGVNTGTIREIDDNADRLRIARQHVWQDTITATDHSSSVIGETATISSVNCTKFARALSIIAVPYAIEAFFGASPRQPLRVYSSKRKGTVTLYRRI